MAIKKLKSITFPGSTDRYVIPEASGNLPVLALPSEQIVTFRKITDITEPDVIEESINITPFGSDSNYYYYRLPGFGYCDITYTADITADPTWETVWSGSKSVSNGSHTASSFNSSVDFSRPTKVSGSVSGQTGGGGLIDSSTILTPGTGSASGGGETTTSSPASGGTVYVYRGATATVSITSDKLLNVSSGAYVRSQFVPTGGTPQTPTTNSQPCYVTITKIEQYFSNSSSSETITETLFINQVKVYIFDLNTGD